MNSSTSDAVLIIAGMHRSATTLTARWLQSCGLYVGDRLLTSKFEHANPEGNHFEDRDFLDLHKAILRDSNLLADGFITTEAVPVLPERVEQARQLVAARAIHQQWGWKDPRTCLLLDFWHEQLPDAKMLVIYRHYTNVVDSMLRRKLNHPKLVRRLFYRLRFTPRQKYIQHYLGVWDRYNRDILAAVRAKPENVLVLNTRDMAAVSTEVIHYMNTRWAFQLEPRSLESLVIKNRLKEQSSYVNFDALGGLSAAVDQANQTLLELDQWRDRSLARLS